MAGPPYGAASDTVRVFSTGAAGCRFQGPTFNMPTVLKGFQSNNKLGEMFIIEDDLHAEPQGEFATFDDAIAELRQRATIPWDQEPNLAPCSSWKTCGRSYAIIEYDSSQQPWHVVQRIPVLKVAASGIKWASGFEN